MDWIELVWLALALERRGALCLVPFMVMNTLSRADGRVVGHKANPEVVLSHSTLRRGIYVAQELSSLRCHSTSAVIRNNRKFYERKYR